ncbi:MAG: 16S rRNA (cytosine(1402)-N(4))-methyltransferase RsmH [Chromatiaceae bacterium]|jgi:16S rRNA (cytosine1402-N4)-methyltransferase|nr:16S rRNA (cytosine(1402)-N(4))-methyltransferase RsmH [Chromatiaceae bacterium]
MTDLAHTPVLLEESLQALAIKPSGVYLDGTFGRGGHARALLARLGPGGRLLAIDRDPAAVAQGEVLARLDPRFAIVHAPFSRLAGVAREAGVLGAVDGLLLDLGVSSPQLDEAERGFGFGVDGPLDMRMDPTSGLSAAEWLAQAPEPEIARVLHELGEERFARRIARALVRARAQAPIATTKRLAELVAAAVPTREPGKHAATRTFQAIRMRVNGELDELRVALGAVCDLLAAGGRLVVISFHSLEDRIVKRFIRDEARGERLPRGLPVRGVEAAGRLRPVGKLVRPSAAEVVANPRARSALMRVAERLA